jgi:hypothetical protein
MNQETLMTNAPTAYYVGDLGYVMRDEWEEMVVRFDYDNETRSYQLADGRTYFMFSTMYGDGAYNDLDGNPYSVDSGTIGAIKVADIKNLDALNAALESGLGHVHTFAYTLSADDCDYFEGKISIASVLIDTDDLEEGYEDEEVEEVV